MSSGNDKWKETLSPEQYMVLREKGTERPFTGELLHNSQDGTYRCAACKKALFSSETKFDSGSGWPSFYDVIHTEAVQLKEDRSHGMQRVEVVCANCGGHLGHVFHDAPEQPTGIRFCVNSVALDFKPAEDKQS
jgi:peptide-methionine (R)-S-oxide reductase